MKKYMTLCATLALVSTTAQAQMMPGGMSSADYFFRMQTGAAPQATPPAYVPPVAVSPAIAPSTYNMPTAPSSIGSLLPGVVTGRVPSGAPAVVPPGADCTPIARDIQARACAEVKNCWASKGTTIPELPNLGAIKQDIISKYPPIAANLPMQRAQEIWTSRNQTAEREAQRIYDLRLKKHYDALARLINARNKCLNDAFDNGVKQYGIRTRGMGCTNNAEFNIAAVSNCF